MKARKMYAPRGWEEESSCIVAEYEPASVNGCVPVLVTAMSPEPDARYVVVLRNRTVLHESLLDRAEAESIRRHYVEVRKHAPSTLRILPVGPAPRVEPDLTLRDHQCEPIADFGRFMNELGQEHAGEREWWVGRITNPIDGFPMEKWCFHIRTPLKPEIVFGFNEADLNYMVATVWAALGYHTSHTWVENIGESAMKAAGRAPESEEGGDE